MTNFNEQLARDMTFVKKILPDTYVISESVHRGAIHCKSADAWDINDMRWTEFIDKILNHFGRRFIRIPNVGGTPFNPNDFTIYLKD